VICLGGDDSYTKGDGRFGLWYVHLRCARHWDSLLTRDLMKAAGRAEPVCISSSGAAEVTSSSEVPSIKQEAYGGEDK